MTRSISPVYKVRKTVATPYLRGDWDGEPWKDCASAIIGNFRKESSAHRPKTEVKMLFGKDALFCIFKVRDKYVRCVHTGYQAEVWKDSCVELFLRPNPLLGYFNIEINCGGELHCSYNEHSLRKKGAKLHRKPLSPKAKRRIEIYHSLPERIETEIPTKVEWIIECKIPLSVFEPHVGKLKIENGDEWRANFYKCADESSHPHWAAWSAVQGLDFHRPQDFGILQFNK